MLGQRCRQWTSNKAAIAARTVAVSVQRQQNWAKIGTTLAASESDKDTAVTVCLPQCQCQSSAITALSRHWRNAGGTGSTRECYNSDAVLTGQHF